MTSTSEHQAPHGLQPPGRLEAFGDGVFAIAITLLVLEISVPAVSGSDLLHGLAEQWPSFLAYGMSFFSIGVIWIAHYGVTRSLRGVDEVFLRLNLLFLFFVAFLPYPTRLVAEFHTDADGERVAATAYSLTLLAISVTLRTLWFYAAEDHRLLAADISDDQISSRSAKLTPVIFFYLAAVFVALIAPRLAVGLLLLAIVDLALPMPVLYRLLHRRRSVRRE